MYIHCTCDATYIAFIPFPNAIQQVSAMVSCHCGLLIGGTEISPRNQFELSRILRQNKCRPPAKNKRGRTGGKIHELSRRVDAEPEPRACDVVPVTWLELGKARANRVASFLNRELTVKGGQRGENDRMISSSFSRASWVFYSKVRVLWISISAKITCSRWLCRAQHHNDHTYDCKLIWHVAGKILL